MDYSQVFCLFVALNCSNYFKWGTVAKFVNPWDFIRLHWSCEFVVLHCSLGKSIICNFCNNHILKENVIYFYTESFIFGFFNDSLKWIFYCFVFCFHWILRTIDKKEVYKNLIKELIKLFDGHILLYILQSLSSMFANIEMCCCIEGILILWILQFKQVA